MKKFLSILLAALFLQTLPVGACATELYPNGLIANQSEKMSSQVCYLTTQKNKTTTFSASYFEKYLGLPDGDIRSITIMSLPTPEQGRLVLDGVEVSLYDVLLRSEVDRLCFAPRETASDGWFSFIPLCSKSVCTTVSMTASSEPNQSPILRNGLCQTAMGIPVRAMVQVSDRNGDAVTLQIAQKPQKGSVVLEGSRYTYTPYPGSSGKDSFTLTGIDKRGGISNEATISVMIDKNQPTIRFQDMKGRPSEYAAVKLCEAGILTGEQYGKSKLFFPEKNMTNGEYLAALLTAAGYSDSLPNTITTGLTNDSQIPTWLKSYVKTAIDKGIITGNSFDTQAVPTQLQAQSMAARLVQASPSSSSVPVYQAVLLDIGLKDLPVWTSSVLTGSSATPISGYTSQPLTREVAAELLISLQKQK